MHQRGILQGWGHSDCAWRCRVDTNSFEPDAWGMIHRSNNGQCCPTRGNCSVGAHFTSRQRVQLALPNIQLAGVTRTRQRRSQSQRLSCPTVLATEWIAPTLTPTSSAGPVSVPFEVSPTSSCARWDGPCGVELTVAGTAGRDNGVQCDCPCRVSGVTSPRHGRTPAGSAENRTLEVLSASPWRVCRG
jgi:hypothetical protein